MALPAMDIDTAQSYPSSVQPKRPRTKSSAKHSETMAVDTVSQSGSTFMRLPKECRELVYANLLTTASAICWPSESQDYQLSPALLRTCRLIHDEAAMVLYKTNTYLFLHPSDCAIFQRIMDSGAAPLISRAVFYIQARSFEKIWRKYLNDSHANRSLSADLPNLKGLAFVLEGSAWNPRHDPEDNLNDWFNKEHAFAGLCHALQITPEDHQPTHGKAEVRIICRQRIPQPHFDRLQTLAVPPTDDTNLTQIALVRSSDTCLRLRHPRNVPSFVSFELLAPGDLGLI